MRHFRQDHYQFFFDRKVNSKISVNAALFLTKGKGYYEQYKADQSYADYNLPNIGNTDLVRQLWLDNDFYGTIFSLQSISDRSQITIGGAATRYNGRHFGEVTWASMGLPTPTYRWYDHDADKDDLTIYLKDQYSINPSWTLFGDLQYRYVNYSIDGFRDNPGLQVSNNYHFFNPKAGISYRKNTWKASLSYAMANKEPNRDDFEAGNNQQPKAEQLHDFELGFERSLPKGNLSATIYYMHYIDQLVLTGKINDVGAYTRTNIPSSYRAGVELQAALRFNSWLHANGNLTLSRNKVIDFYEYLDDYDNGGQKQNFYSTADIAYSPSIVAAATLTFIPFKNTELGLMGKYVGDQYLDNTNQQSRKLDAFYVQDLRFIFNFKSKWLKEASVIAQLNNVFDEKYEPNGYTYSYIYAGEQITENFYFPMAGRNFMLALNIKL